jgi:hypothetical protein
MPSRLLAIWYVSIIIHSFNKYLLWTRELRSEDPVRQYCQDQNAYSCTGEIPSASNRFVITSADT